jgi:ribosomal protein S18 acetylase RimI-like enzyme
MTDTQVIRLEANQINQAGEVLANAFYDDPVANFVTSEESDTKLRKLKWFFSLSVRYCQPLGSIYTTAGSLKGIAIWFPPETFPPSIVRMMRLGMYALPFKFGWGATIRIINALNHLEEFHKQNMPQPHWYLSNLGVVPACQGQGIGGLLLQPILQQADSLNLPCYLESSKQKNIKFYQKHGFEVVQEINIPNSDLRLWAMKREAHLGR